MELNSDAEDQCNKRHIYSSNTTESTSTFRPSADGLPTASDEGSIQTTANPAP